MKTRLITFLCFVAAAAPLFAQSPTATPPAISPSPAASAAAGITASAAATISPSPSATADADDDVARAVKRKLRHRMGITIDGHDKDVDFTPEDAGGIAIAIVGVIFTTLFGAPVLIVAAVMFFSYLKSRSLHRTVRTMVEKGQPVPPELFATPGSPAKARSDLRRGIILSSLGAGLIFFLAGINGGFSGGEWAVGVIPLMIGAGYLLVWKLEGPKKDNHAPLS